MITRRAKKEFLVQLPWGRHFISAAAWPGDTSLSFDARRFCLLDLAASRWRKPGVRRMSLPVAVSLKRLATDFLVFCMEMIPPGGAGQNM